MKKKITTIGWLIAGNLCYSAALDFFLVGNEIAAGGFAGIATLINHYISVPIGSAVFIMNLPLIIWAWKSKGKDYALNCITGNILFTIIADLLSIAPTLTHIKWIAAVFGGIIYGIGITIMIYAKGAAGGTDLLSRLLIQLKPFEKISAGTMILILDGLVVIASAFVYGNIPSALYTLFGILIYSMTSDTICKIKKIKV